MISSAPSSVDALIAYAARYDPGFPGRLRGAGPEQIERLEELSGYRLPGTYKRFLQRMGQDADRIQFEDCHTSLEFMFSFYAAMRVNPDLTVPAGCLAIATYGIAAGEICLDMRSGPEPRVLLVVDEDETDTYAASLLALLYHAVFYDYRLVALPHVDYTSSYQSVGARDRRAEARALSEGLGFRGQWFDEDINFHGERDDAALYWSQPPEHGLTLRVAAPSPAEAEAVGAQFVRTFGIRAYSPRQSGAEAGVGKPKPAGTAKRRKR